MRFEVNKLINIFVTLRNVDLQVWNVLLIRFQSGTIGASESRWASEYLEEFDHHFQSDISRDPVSKAAKELHGNISRKNKMPDLSTNLPTL